MITNMKSVTIGQIKVVRKNTAEIDFTFTFHNPTLTTKIN